MVISSIITGAKSLVTPLIQPLFVPFLYWTLASLGTILSLWTNGDRIQDENEFINPVQAKPYDFIIVGAGSAGCLVANRLSRHYSVLLIEAGGEPNPLQFIPQFSLFFTNYPEVDWMHRSVPQKYGSLMSVNGQSSWSTGLGLGGTGMLNYMIHLRGHHEDFQNWAKLTGDPSWSWEGVLPFFKSYENYEVPGDPVNHGYRGDLRIEAAQQPPSARLFVKAAHEYGFPNVDLNAPFTEGFDILRYPISRGVRQSPYKAFLEPIRYRKSLTIVKFSVVTKILMKEGNIAYGVEYDRHGKSYSATARREVIISAGAVGSPKLLMLSGIGPKYHLDNLNIPVVADLPVGKNLMDHLGVYLGPFFIRPGLGNFLDRDLTVGQFIKYFTLGKGKLTSTGCEASGLWSSKYARERGEAHWPDMQIFSYGFTNIRGGARKLADLFNLKFDDLEPYLRNDVGKDSLYLIVSGARPLSRGYIKLGGSSPYDKLIIDPNYLGDKEGTDLKVLLEAVKTTVHMLENTTTGGVELGARFTNTRLPGCDHLTFRSDEYWSCFIRRFSVTLHHPSGTCGMGNVVDTQLRVVGIRGLRVIDASIQPQVVLTNTQASTLMIAEKGADMIINYWKGVEKGFYRKTGNIKWGGSGGSYWGTGKRNVLLEAPSKINASVAYSPTGKKPDHEVPSYMDSSQMKMKLTKAFEDLKMVGEIAKDNYNEHFKRIDVASEKPTVATTIATTTTTHTHTQDDQEYYDDEGYASADDENYDDFQEPGKTVTQSNVQAAATTPSSTSPSPLPKPARVNDQHSHNGYKGRETTTSDFRNEEIKNSVDDIDDYYTHDSKKRSA